MKQYENNGKKFIITIVSARCKYVGESSANLTYVICLYALKRWSIKYGAGLLGAVSGITGIYINQHYRRRLRLGTYGAFSTYLTIVALPALMSTVYHRAVSLQRNWLSCFQVYTENVSNISVCPVRHPFKKGKLPSLLAGTSGSKPNRGWYRVSLCISPDCHIHGNASLNRNE